MIAKSGRIEARRRAVAFSVPVLTLRAAQRAELPVIEFQEVDKSFADSNGGTVPAVRGLSLQVPPGQTHCLIGTSGCGKTTTLRMVNRLVEPSRGRVLVGGEDVASQDVIALRRRIGYVVQSGGLFPHMTVRQNIGVLCELEGWSKERTRERVDALLQLVRLPAGQFADRRPRELSGGQQQRIGMARALALDPDLLLLDEPFGALDPITRDQMQEEIAELLRTVGKTVLLVTHDLGEAFRLADSVSVMHDGSILQTGDERELRGNPATRFVAEFLAAHAPHRR